jgi:hypothetical protein
VAWTGVEWSGEAGSGPAPAPAPGRYATRGEEKQLCSAGWPIVSRSGVDGAAQPQPSPARKPQAQQHCNQGAGAGEGQGGIAPPSSGGKGKFLDICTVKMNQRVAAAGAKWLSGRTAATGTHRTLRAPVRGIQTARPFPREDRPKGADCHCRLGHFSLWKSALQTAQVRRRPAACPEHISLAGQECNESQSGSEERVHQSSRHFANTRNSHS